jgi:hypothetical protein
MFDVDENIIVPENIDDYIRKGIALGVKKKKANKIKLMANAAVISILTLFTVSVRTSPAFAAYMAKLPGLEYLVKFINYDKGLQSAIENNFIQNINSSVTKEGIKFTIKDVIIDNSKALIFYSIENQIDNRYIELENVKPTNENGEELKEFTSSWGSSRPDEVRLNKEIEGMVELNFNDKTILPNVLHLEVKLRNEDFIDGTNYIESRKKSILASSWNYEIPLDKEKIKSMEKSYVLNQTVEVEGQKITLKEVKITPTRIAVEIEYDENNSKKVLGYEDIRIVDEKGEQWGTIMNGVTASRLDDNHEILYFQSSYFNMPKKLYIKASNIRALDKDKLDVVVDLENNKLLKAPDERLNLSKIQKTEKETYIIFGLESEKAFDDKFNGFIFSGSFKDSNGKTYNNSGMETWVDGLKDEVKKPMINFKIDNDPEITGPIYIKLYNYPERISKDFEVRIK